MDELDLIEDKEFYGIIGVLIIDPDTNRRRVITKGNQVVPDGLFIECSKKVREQQPLGTIFKLNIGVSRKPIGRLYLHSLRKQELLTVDEWEQKYK